MLLHFKHFKAISSVLMWLPTKAAEAKLFQTQLSTINRGSALLHCTHYSLFQESVCQVMTPAAQELNTAVSAFYSAITLKTKRKLKELGKHSLLLWCCCFCKHIRLICIEQNWSLCEIKWRSQNIRFFKYMFIRICSNTVFGVLLPG